jgi:hypothetical protein
VAGENAHELLHIVRGSLGEREQLVVGSRCAEPGCGQRKGGERLAARGRAALLCSETYGPLQMLAHAVGVALRRPREPASNLELARPERRCAGSRGFGGAVQPAIR